MKVRQLSEALRRKAEEELNEHEENIESNLKILKNWFNEHFEEKTIQPLDQWLIAFLRGCKHNLEKSQRKLEKYYTLKKSAPDFFAHRGPYDQKIQALLNLGLFLPLRKCVKEDSPRICLVRVAQLCNSGYNLADLTKIGFMIAELLLLEDDNFTIVGEDVVADMKNVGFSILTQWTPNMARKIFACAQNALTVRLKSVHIINAPRGLKAAVTVFKMFLTAKLKQRTGQEEGLMDANFVYDHLFLILVFGTVADCHFYTIYIYNEDYESMYEHIPKSVLPVEYGGTDGNIQDLTDHWKTKIETHSNWFAEFDKVSDEFKKPKKSAARTLASTNNEQRTFQSLEFD